MTIDQIINGAPEFNFPGLLPLVQDYLRNIEVDTDTMCTLSRYWNYVQKKASGKLMTNARFIRKYILEVRTTIVYLFSIFFKTIYFYSSIPNTGKTPWSQNPLLMIYSIISIAWNLES